MRLLYAVPVFLLLFLDSCTSDSIEETSILEAENVITIEQDLLDIVNEHRLTLNTNTLEFSDIAYKKTMEGDFTHTGISVKKDEQGNYYFTQLFYKQ